MENTLAGRIALRFRKQWEKNDYAFSDGKSIEIWIRQNIEDELSAVQENKLEGGDIIVTGKCANCGVEYHIHKEKQEKELPKPTNEEMYAWWVKRFDRTIWPVGFMSIVKSFCDNFMPKITREEPMRRLSDNQIEDWLRKNHVSILKENPLFPLDLQGLQTLILDQRGDLLGSPEERASWPQKGGYYHGKWVGLGKEPESPTTSPS